MHTDSPEPLDWEVIATGEEAKKKIIELIGRDYDSLTSTSFLLQGQGEKLIEAKPTERYKVVFDILGLNRYEEWRQRIVKKKNILSGQKEALIKVVDELKVKAGRLAEITSSKEQAEKKTCRSEEGATGKGNCLFHKDL